MERRQFKVPGRGLRPAPAANSPRRHRSVIPREISGFSSWHWPLADLRGSRRGATSTKLGGEAARASWQARAGHSGSVPPEILNRPCSLGGVSGVNMGGRLETAWDSASGDLVVTAVLRPNSLDAHD